MEFLFTLLVFIILHIISKSLSQKPNLNYRREDVCYRSSHSHIGKNHLYRNQNGIITHMGNEYIERDRSGDIRKIGNDYIERDRCGNINKFGNAITSISTNSSNKTFDNEDELILFLYKNKNNDR